MMACVQKCGGRQYRDNYNGGLISAMRHRVAHRIRIPVDVKRHDKNFCCRERFLSSCTTATLMPTLCRETSITQNLYRSGCRNSIDKVNLRGRPCTRALPLPVAFFDASFNFATVAVMPFYLLMVVAPRWSLTRRLLNYTGSNIPPVQKASTSIISNSKSPFICVALAVLYFILLVGSWQSDTIKLMFNNKYYMPELSGICTMFSRMRTVSSAWVHLLTADLLVAISIYKECMSISEVESTKLANKANVPHHHSVILCLLFGPLGYLSHVITKYFCQRTTNIRHSANESVPESDCDSESDILSTNIMPINNPTSTSHNEPQDILLVNNSM